MSTKRFHVECEVPYAELILNEYPHTQDNKVWKLSLTDIEEIYKRLSKTSLVFTSMEIAFDFVEDNDHDGLLIIKSS
jgi:hypothetical protein